MCQCLECDKILGCDPVEGKEHGTHTLFDRCSEHVGLKAVADVRKRSAWYVDGSGAKDKESFGKICVLKEGSDPTVMEVQIRGVTNNTCEYIAMRGALRSCDKGDVIYTDSQLVCEQLTGGWKINFDHLQKLNSECKEIMREKGVKIVWIQREKNLAGKWLEKEHEEERRSWS